MVGKLAGGSQSSTSPQARSTHGQQLCELAVLGHKKCKSPQDTSIFILELERRIQEVVETSGEAPGDKWMSTSLLSGMDERTKWYCAAGIKRGASFTIPKTAVMAFVNLVCGTSMPSKKDAMDIDQIGEEESEKSWERETWWGDERGEGGKMTKAV